MSSKSQPGSLGRFLRSPFGTDTKDPAETMKTELPWFLNRAERVPLEAHDATTHRHEEIVAATRDDASATSWSVDDTIQALEGIPYDEHVGLKFYHEDPLPRIEQECSERKFLFVDHEFPTHEPVIANGKRVAPGIITSSNCRDFQSQGPKRANRIRHFVGNAEHAWAWVRASSMKNHSIFSSDGASIDPRNVLQGKVGNCGFCSGFASVAADFPYIIRNSLQSPWFTSMAPNHGAFRVRLFPHGRERYLLLDDFILCRKDDDSYGSPSLHSLEKHDLWIRFLEKVFVKIQGSYASLDGYYKYTSLYRHPARALQLLTGAPVAIEIHYNPRVATQVYILLLISQSVCARVVHCRKNLDGLRSNHGYSLLWVGEAAEVRLVCLRNPHGCRSYTGKYGYGSRAWEQNKAVASALMSHDCFVSCSNTPGVTWWRGGDGAETELEGKETGDNGIFFMEFPVFVQCFPIATVVGPIWDPPRLCPSLTEHRDCIYRINPKNLRHAQQILELAKRIPARKSPFPLGRGPD